MKKLYPEVPDLPQHMANRAVRIVEKHLRLHHVTRARDLPEEAKVRLYRDLRFFYESGGQAPGPSGTGSSWRRFFSNAWEKIQDFLSACAANRSSGPLTVFAWMSWGEPAGASILPWNSIAARERST